MNAQELIEKLSALTDEERQMPVCVHDGLDPSDPMEATSVEVREHFLEKKPAVHIESR